MRKLLTILALVLTVALCASFAVSAEVETDKMDALGSVSKDVVVNYEAAATDTTTVVYSVDVAWEDVSFSYHAGVTKWNPQTHDYSAVGSNAEWTDVEGSVTVSNHSNADIDVTVSFAKAEAANGTADITVANGSFTLESAVDKDTDAADSATATLTASGVPVSNATIGTVTVAIAAAQ